MKTLITIIAFASTVISLVGFMSFMTNGFSVFELESLAQKATQTVNYVKGWFQ